MANNRIYYAIQQVVLGKSAGTIGTGKVAVRGLQTVGVTTNFNLEQVFEMGQLAIYQNIENIPDIEVTLNKVLDGYPLMYVLATELGTSIGTFEASGPTIPGRQNARTDVELSIFSDQFTRASGTPNQVMVCSGMYVSSVSYTFPVDGNFTEDLTLVGNSKIWKTSGMSNGAFTSEDSPLATQGVGRRQYLNMSACRFPNQIPGIVSGVNSPIGNGSGYSVHFQNISVNCDLGRDTINELGTFVPYHRYVTFPVEVTSEFEVLAVSGDAITAAESGYYTADSVAEANAGNYSVADGSEGACAYKFNLLNDTIFLETCEGTRIYLGAKNKLSSVNYNGGDTGGGNVTVTYSYSNFNDFAVAHSGGDYYDSVTATGIL